MFYIDFTTPEGRSYRIDVSKHPVIFECPICKEKTFCYLDPTADEFCAPCRERKRQEEEKMLNDRLYRQLADYLNQEYNSDLTPDDIEVFMNDPEGKRDIHQSTVDFIKKLEENQPNKTIVSRPKIIRIPAEKKIR